MMKNKGFTLVEILISLVIFSILALMLSGALRTVINAVSGTEANAERVRNLQFALLVMSRDIEQTINRPALTVTGKESPAFVGTPEKFAFTHSGVANPMHLLGRSNLQRCEYFVREGKLWRGTWPVLDQAQTSKMNERVILNNVEKVQFEYLDTRARFHEKWPEEGFATQPLPAAVRINLTISNWGNVQQLYVISTKPTKSLPQAPTSPQP